jgi:DNA-directed RNA polymerase subunit K/omega
MTSKGIPDYNELMKDYDPNKNSTKPILSKYEKTKIIGFRMEQLARGAEPYVEIIDNAFEPGEIAMRELKERKLPFMVRRTLPNGQHEIFRLCDMLIF